MPGLRENHSAGVAPPRQAGILALIGTPCKTPALIRQNRELAMFRASSNRAWSNLAWPTRIGAVVLLLGIAALIAFSLRTAVQLDTNLKAAGINPAQLHPYHPPAKSGPA
jgi:hypothetical protein